MKNATSERRENPPYELKEGGEPEAGQCSVGHRQGLKWYLGRLQRMLFTVKLFTGGTKLSQYGSYFA